MSLIKSQQIIHLNSKFRESGTDDSFTTRINLKKNNNFDHVAVLSCSIPKSYYLVPLGENTFVIRENGNDIMVTIPEGNYSITSFLYVLNNLFTGTLSHYSTSFPDSKTQPQTGKLTFTNTNNTASTFIFENNHLPEIFGFERGSSNTFTIGQTSSSLVSQNVCNFNKESTIYLRSSLCSNGGEDDILLELFCSSNPDYSTINFDNSGNLEEHSKKLVGGLSNIFNFTLTDEYGSRINLNGINCLITLCFYEKNNIDNLITGYIKYKTLMDSEKKKK